MHTTSTKNTRNGTDVRKDRDYIEWVSRSVDGKFQASRSSWLGGH